MEQTYTELLERLLIMEYDKTPEQASEFIKNNQKLVAVGIMQGNLSLNAVALILEDMFQKIEGAE